MTEGWERWPRPPGGRTHNTDQPGGRRGFAVEAGHRGRQIAALSFQQFLIQYQLKSPGQRRSIGVPKLGADGRAQRDDHPHVPVLLAQFGKPLLDGLYDLLKRGRGPVLEALPVDVDTVRLAATDHRLLL